MKARRILGKNKKNYIMDLTPLIDVVFLLLIFFMVATNFSNMSGMEIKLPGTKSLEKTTEIKKLRLLVDINKNLLVQYEDKGQSIEKAIKAHEIYFTLENLLKLSQNKNVSLVADKDLDYGYIVSLMEEAKRAGAQGLSIETEGEK